MRKQLWLVYSDAIIVTYIYLKIVFHYIFQNTHATYIRQ